jgi:uncharacterized membrane protein YeaQ/YmgE (transglycosylase-associated protein family)
MIWMLIIGFFVGAVAKFLMPGRDPGGFIVTIVLGIAGAMVAGWLGARTGLYVYGEPVGFFAAVIGAMVVLLLYRAFSGRTA